METKTKYVFSYYKLSITVRNRQTSSRAAAPSAFLPAINEHPCCSTASPAFDAVSVLDLSHSSKSAVISPFDLLFIFPRKLQGRMCLVGPTPQGEYRGP